MRITPNSRMHFSSTIFSVLLTFGLITLCANVSNAQIGQPSEDDEPSIQYRNIDVATFDELRKDWTNIKVDVRPAAEVASSRLGGSLELDFDSASFVSELEMLDKNVHYLVFSTNGTNSAKAAQMMVDLGFTNVSNLQGGFALWQATDRPPE